MKTVVIASLPIELIPRIFWKFHLQLAFYHFNLTFNIKLLHLAIVLQYSILNKPNKVQARAPVITPI